MPRLLLVTGDARAPHRRVEFATLQSVERGDATRPPVTGAHSRSRRLPSATATGWPLGAICTGHDLHDPDRLGEDDVLRSEGDRLRRVTVCSPQVDVGRGRNEPLHDIGGVEGPDAAVRQHDLLERRMRGGVEVLDGRELAGHPNSVVTRDTAVSTAQGYVRLQLGLPTGATPILQ